MATDKFNHTMRFDVRAEEETNAVRLVLESVYAALREKGYNPINQLVGYFLSGDPAFITGHNNARSIIRKLERDELLEELLRAYLEKDPQKKR